MPVSERAKQFTPFAALKGLPEALAEKEKIRMTRAELSEDRIRQINDLLRVLRPGDLLTAVYYLEETYVQLTGRLKKTDPTERFLQIGETRIPFSDLYELIPAGDPSEEARRNDTVDSNL